MQSPGINSSCFLLVTLGLGQMEYLCVWWFCLAVVALKLFNSGLFISAFSAEAAQIIWLLSYFSPKGKKITVKNWFGTFPVKLFSWVRGMTWNIPTEKITNSAVCHCYRLCSHILWISSYPFSPVIAVRMETDPGWLRCRVLVLMKLLQKQQFTLAPSVGIWVEDLHHVITALKQLLFASASLSLQRPAIIWCEKGTLIGGTFWGVPWSPDAILLKSKSTKN